MIRWLFILYFNLFWSIVQYDDWDTCAFGNFGHSPHFSLRWNRLSPTQFWRRRLREVTPVVVVMVVVLVVLVLVVIVVTGADGVFWCWQSLLIATCDISALALVNCPNSSKFPKLLFPLPDVRCSFAGHYWSFVCLMDSDFWPFPWRKSD